MTNLDRWLIPIAVAASFGAVCRIPIGLVPALAALAAACLLATTIHAQLSSVSAPPVFSAASGTILVLLAGVGATHLSISAASVVAAAGAIISFAGRDGRVLRYTLTIVVWRVVSILVILSFVAGAAVPASFENGRLRGIFENANGLGVSLAIWVCVAPARWLYAVCPAALGASWLAGSRAGLLSVVVGSVFRLPWSRFPAGTRLLGVGLLVLAAPLALERISAEAVQDSTSVLRTNDSRSDRWVEGLNDARSSFPYGLGLGSASREYASSPILAAVEGGILGGTACALAYMLALRKLTARSTGGTRRSLVAALFANSFFEGWMFAFGSPYALVFWIALLGGRAMLESKGEAP